MKNMPCANTAALNAYLAKQDEEAARESWDEDNFDRIVSEQLDENTALREMIIDEFLNAGALEDALDACGGSIIDDKAPNSDVLMCFAKACAKSLNAALEKVQESIPTESRYKSGATVYMDSPATELINELLDKAYEEYCEPDCPDYGGDC